MGGANCRRPQVGRNQAGGTPEAGNAAAGTSPEERHNPERLRNRPELLHIHPGELLRIHPGEPRIHWQEGCKGERCPTGGDSRLGELRKSCLKFVSASTPAKLTDEERSLFDMVYVCED